MSPHENMLLLLIRGKYMMPFRDSAVYHVVQILYPNYKKIKKKYILSLSLTHTYTHACVHTHKLHREEQKQHEADVTVAFPSRITGGMYKHITFPFVLMSEKEKQTLNVHILGKKEASGGPEFLQKLLNNLFHFS